MRAGRARSEVRGGTDRGLALAAFVLLNGIVGLLCLYAAGAGADLFLRMMIRPPVEAVDEGDPESGADIAADGEASTESAAMESAVVETAVITPGPDGSGQAEAALAYGGMRTADAPPLPGGEARAEPAVAISPPESAWTPRERVALTFDDGPDGKYTPMVLDILAEYGVTATFFVVGVQAERYPDVLARIRDEGHEIGSHGYAHADMGRMSAVGAAEDLLLADEAIRNAAGVVPTLFRPPYGSVSDDLKSAVSDAGKTLVRWNVDPRDWDGTPAESIASHVLERARDGAVILLHSFGGKNSDLSGTIEALPAIIEGLLARGFELTTVSELERDGG